MLLSGRKLAKTICNSIKNGVSKQSTTPGLGIILVGDDPASKIYVDMKSKACKQVGFQYSQFNLPKNSTEREVIQHINYLNYSSDIHGILVQLPLPPHLNERTILDKILVEKDVDCFHTENFGKLALSVNTHNAGKFISSYNPPITLPCTPRGILTILDAHKIDVKGKKVTIIGSSNIVGLPMSLILLNRGATLSICNKNTQNVSEFTKKADIIIVATGNPNLIKKKDIRKNSIIIDVGINRLESGEIVGDVDFEDVKYTVSAITPVPGGVGPMTIAMVLQNTYDLYKQSLYRENRFRLI